jgi:hypothetical protein
VFACLDFKFEPSYPRKSEGQYALTWLVQALIRLDDQLVLNVFDSFIILVLCVATCAMRAVPMRAMPLKPPYALVIRRYEGLQEDVDVQRC